MAYLGWHAPGTLPIFKGDRVRIKKGTEIRITNGTRRTAQRDYLVTVHHVLPGRTDHSMGHLGKPIETHVENPMVVWPGTGGYWHEVDINLVEKVVK